MKTKLVNAGIKSRQDAIERLIKGEIFYCGESYWKIYYDINRINEGKSPFRCKDDPLQYALHSYLDWKVEEEVKWYEDIPEKGVLCWVGCRADNRVTLIKRFVESDGYQFKSETGNYYNAIPLTREEVLSLCLDE